MADFTRALIKPMRPYASELVNLASQNGWQPKITSTRRSHSQQARLYRLYLAGRNPFPVAPPGTSAHEFGYAFDMTTMPFSALKRLGPIWQSWGGIWGGAFEDIIHFEFPGFPHSAVHSARAHGFLYRHRADLANLGLSVIPGPVGILAGISNPVVNDDVPWWEDPQGAAHGLLGVLKRPFTQGP